MALISDTLAATVARHGDRPAMHSKHGGRWHTITWREAHTLTRRVAAGFLQLGLQPGDGVSILSANRAEWLLSDLGAILAGGIPVGIYATNSAEQCQYIIDHAECTIAVVEDAAQLAKVLSVRRTLPRLKAIVLMTGTSAERDVFSWDAMLALAPRTSQADLDARIAAQRPDHVCTLIYTSGTTGNPKAVMCTHDNITWTAWTMGQSVNMDSTDCTLSYLPYSHIAEQEAFYALMTAGASTWFAESMDRLGDNLREVRPTLFFAVPRVWEKIEERMTTAGAALPPLQRRIGAWARRIGLSTGAADEAGRPRPWLFPLANALLFSKVRRRLGFDRTRAFFSTAAPIARSTLEYFRSVGIPIGEVYGMSECSGPTTISTPGRSRMGTVGIAMTGSELRIAEDGEICMRGRHVFKGYFKNPDASAEMVDADGWLKSGDVGSLDADGYLTITDRKKDLLITAGGENVAPQMIEAHLKSVPVVSQAVVIGDRRKYLVALLTLDPEKIATTAVEAGSDARDVVAAATCSAYTAWMQRRVDDVNRGLARVQTIKRFTIVPNEFTVDGGELTPTMKVRRKVINQRYADLIEAMYQE
ncbi:MAG: AMP-binding protein [Gemmatimonadaceae bacterium]|nr:AMP-binding protein [Gemmatimonadaceae bacterium]